MLQCSIMSFRPAVNIHRLHVWALLIGCFCFPVVVLILFQLTDSYPSTCPDLFSYSVAVLNKIVSDPQMSFRFWRILQRCVCVVGGSLGGPGPDLTCGEADGQNYRGKEEKSDL